MFVYDTQSVDQIKCNTLAENTGRQRTSRRQLFFIFSFFSIDEKDDNILMN